MAVLICIQVCSGYFWSLQECFYWVLWPSKHGLDTILVELSVKLVELYWEIDISVMAALICIKMIHGTFFDFVNTANRFLHIFSDIVTSVRSLFPGGAGNPLFRTQLLFMWKIVKKLKLLASFSEVLYHLIKHCGKRNARLFDAFYGSSIGSP